MSAATLRLPGSMFKDDCLGGDGQGTGMGTGKASGCAMLLLIHIIRWALLLCCKSRLSGLPAVPSSSCRVRTASNNQPAGQQSLPSGRCPWSSCSCGQVWFMTAVFDCHQDKWAPGAGELHRARLGVADDHCCHELHRHLGAGRLKHAKATAAQPHPVRLISNACIFLLAA